MMDLRILTLLPLLAACSGETDQPPAPDPEQAATALVERPAGAPPAGPQEVIGATPGPCGSTKASAFLGKSWSAEVAAAMKESSGAAEVEVARVMTDAEAAAKGLNARRLNVVLNDSGKIILLDCG